MPCGHTWGGTKSSHIPSWAVTPSDHGCRDWQGRGRSSWESLPHCGAEGAPVCRATSPSQSLSPFPQSQCRNGVVTPFWLPSQLPCQLSLSFPLLSAFSPHTVSSVIIFKFTLANRPPSMQPATFSNTRLGSRLCRYSDGQKALGTCPQGVWGLGGPVCTRSS